MNVQPAPDLVSVIVASYNHEKFLVRRMESLIAQTYAHIEIIVIDDHSPDHSVEILQKYASHPKVKLVLRESNGGWIVVSNQGLGIARGEFVLFANCDDDCDPCMIERLVKGLRENPSAGIAYCRSLMIDENNQHLGDDYAVREPRFRARCVSDTLLSGAEMSRFLLKACVIPNLSAALFRKECFRVVGDLSSDYRVCCDWELFFRIVARYDVFYVAQSLNRFRQHRNTVRKTTAERIVYEEYFRLLLGQIRRLKLSSWERILFRTHIMYLWTIHLTGPSRHGWKNFGYHFGRVAAIDPKALGCLVPALIWRAWDLFGKTIEWVTKYLRSSVRTFSSVFLFL